ncbi:hypothetical protein F5148DRAFT_972766 [Russula earlei]|uniref:Uncharacterized protein n=1 Tax=Russula earlei TaxID=71964 RepID=A0ACC0UPW0_9AGAM|nr:hypothetical protein F5148DRAFT_972766 [Russula earlei]
MPLRNLHPIKVTAKVNLSDVITVHSRPPSRPHSPSKLKAPQPPSSMLSEPVFRPRAKVSSSAITSIGRTSSSSSTENSTAKSTARPSSPFKRTQSHARKVSSTRSAVDAPISRPMAALAPHELSRQRSLTSTLEASVIVARRSSGTAHATPPASPSPRHSPDNTSTSPAVRVRAKVSGMAKSNGFSTSPTPPSSSHPSSPSFATMRPVESRSRAPSIADLRSLGSRPPSPTAPFVVHPITTPTSAANPHRYTPRIPANTASSRFFPPLSPATNRDLDHGVHVRVSAKIDPAAIPLPPQSPPSSTLSFSSQSSRDTLGSSISCSTAPTPNSHAPTTLATAERGGIVLDSGPTFDVFDRPCDSNSPGYSLGSPATYSEQPDDSDRQIRAEAKTNRKIEDLEITNRSLLAINASLEATKHRKDTEIRELRRKLRESRLMLPPRAYRAIKSSLSPEETADDDEDMDDDDGDEHDETYRRIKGMLEGLLEMGRRALRAEPRDFGTQGTGVKVLSAEEVRSWQGGMGDVFSIHSAPTDAETDEEHHPPRRSPPSSRAAVPGDGEITSIKDDDERAVETGGDQQNVEGLPPITVTFS